jgi:hypothetical protein
MVLSASCAGRAAFVVPGGPGTLAPEAAAIWTPIAESCRSISSYRSEFALTGQIGTQRIRGLASAKLYTALAATGHIGLEANVSGQLLFRLGGDADKAVLLLRDQNRVAAAPPDEILEALIGVPVNPARLLAIVSGCVTTAASIERTARHNEVLEIVTDDATVYLTSVGTGWQVRAGRFADVSVDYFAFERGLPRDFRLSSSGPDKASVSLDLRVQVVQTNVTLDPALFRVTMPEGAMPISLDELRRAGPLGEQTSR